MSPQVLIDGIIAGSTIGLGAIGLTLTYAILRFANFTHGDFLAWGAYMTLTVSGFLGGLLAALASVIRWGRSALAGACLCRCSRGWR